jgi:hypothetical protein
LEGAPPSLDSFCDRIKTVDVVHGNGQCTASVLPCPTRLANYPVLQC